MAITKVGGANAATHKSGSHGKRSRGSEVAATDGELGDAGVDSGSHLARKIWVRAQLRELARNGRLGLRVRTEPVVVGGPAPGSSDRMLQGRQRVPEPTKLAAVAKASAEAHPLHHRSGELILSDAMA